MVHVDSFANFKQLSIKLSVLSASMLMLMSCGSEQQNEDSHLSFSSLINSNPLFVISGGNDSCVEKMNAFSNKSYLQPQIMKASNPGGTGVFVALNEMLRSTGYSIEHVDIIFSCFQNRDLYYAHSDQSNQIMMAKSNFSSYFNFVNNTWNLKNYSQAFAIGHSYGGWLMMKTVLAVNSDKMFDGVFTIDPISYDKCSFTKPFGCQSAPTDFSSLQKKQIEAKSINWINFYQDKTFYLHSSSIKEADENIKINTSHTSIDIHASVWQKINNILNQ